MDARVKFTLGLAEGQTRVTGHDGVSYDPLNFSSLMASKSCTPPPTRLVV